MLSELKPYLTAIVFSPTLLLLCIALGVFIYKKKTNLGRFVVIFSTAILWFFSTPVVSNWLNINLLAQYQPTSAEAIKAVGVQAIVVLGGGVDSGQPDGIQQLKPTALDRLRHGIVLSRRSDIPILVAGGRGWGADAGSENEAEISRRVALEAFQYEIKWTESESRDTQENALNSKKLLSKQSISKIALVTHSWHMPRAVIAFQQVGFVVIPAPMAYQAGIKIELLSLLPNGLALNSSVTTFKELAALLVQAQ